MSYPIKFALILLPLIGCKKDKDEEPDPVDTGVEIDLSCEKDNQCEPYEYCDTRKNKCVDGDQNNSADGADDILLETWEDGYIFPAGDVDWYEFKADKPMWVRIETKSNTINPDDEDGAVHCQRVCYTPTSTQYPWDDSECFERDPSLDLNTVVTIKRANGATHAQIDDFGTGPVLIYDSLLMAYLPEAGKYYITVEDREGRGNKDYYYCLDVMEWTAHTTEFDSAANPSYAVDLTGANSIYSVGVNIETAGDIDYIEMGANFDGSFSFTGIGAYNPTFDRIPGSDAQPLIRLQDPNGDVVLEKSGIGDDTSAYYPLINDTEDYVLEATDALGNGSADHWYVLYMRTGEDRGGSEVEVEPNDTQGAAFLPTELSGTTSAGLAVNYFQVLGRLDPSNDEDWFSVPLNANEYFTLFCSADALGALGNTRMEIYNSGGTKVAEETIGSDNAPDSENFQAPSNDTYGLRIVSEDNVFGPGVWYRCTGYTSLTPW